jgi:hypothetical protein
VVRDQLRISLAEALEKARRPLNVAKQESDGSSGQICQSLRPQQRIPARSAGEGNRVLGALADSAPEEERSFLRRAAGTVGRLGDEIVRSTLSGIAGDLGKDVVE